MIIWRMRTARCTPKATNTHSEYVTLFAFPLQQWLYERASILRCVIPVVCRKTNGEVNFSHETQLW